MAILTTIGGIPLFSITQEALQWASSRGIQGLHTHIYQGQTGYMGGASHNIAAATLGLNGNNQTGGSGGY